MQRRSGKDNGDRTGGGKNVRNPWQEISLDDYENHMKLDSVMQLQTLDSMMKEQLNDYPVSSVMILGVAGGNGLRHVPTERISKIYGVDINPRYLEETVARYGSVSYTHLDVYKRQALEAAQVQKEYFAGPLGNDVFQCSPMPWVTYTHISHTNSGKRAQTLSTFMTAAENGCIHSVSLTIMYAGRILR